MPDREDILAELQRRGINPDAMQGAEMGQEQEPQMPLQMQQDMAAQAEAQAFNPAFQQEAPMEEDVVTEELLSPTDIKGLMYRTPEKKSTKKADKVYPSTYDYNGVSLDLSAFPAIEGQEPRNKIEATQKSSTEALQQVKEAKALLAKVKKHDQELALLNKVKQDDPLIGKHANKARDVISYYNKDKNPESREQSKDRIALEKLLAQIRINADKALTGQSLGVKAYELMEQKGIHPELAQGLDVVEEQLSNLENGFSNAKRWAGMSLHTGRSIPSDEVSTLIERATVDKLTKENPEYEKIPYERRVEILKKLGVL